MLYRNPDQAPRLGKWSTLTVAVLAVAAFAAGAGFGYLRATAAGLNRALPQDKGKTDVHGDPLPQGARARMGTVRWRHGDNVTFVAYTPDGKAVVTASQDGVLRLWDRETGKEIRRFQGPAPKKGPKLQPGGQPVWTGINRGTGSVALSRDGKVLAAAYLGFGVQLWDVDTGAATRLIKTPALGMGGLLFAPDGKTLIARGGNRIIYLLETATGNELRQIMGKQPQGGNVVIISNVNQGGPGMAISPDGKTLAVAETVFNQGNITSHVRVVDMAAGKDLRQLDEAEAVAGLTYSPDGKILAYGIGNTVLLRDAATYKEIRKIDNPGGTTNLAFSPDGNTLATKVRDQVIRLWETKTGKNTHQLGEAVVFANANVVVFTAIAGFGTQDFVFSPDGKAVLAAAGQTLRLFEVGTGKEKAVTGGGHRGPVYALAVSPDGKTLVSQGGDNVLRRWDAITGKELAAFPAPPGTQKAAFSPDGKTAALGVGDTVRLIDTTTGKELHQLKGHTNGTVALAFSPNGKTLASCGFAEIRLHDVAKGTPLKDIALPNSGGNMNVVVVGNFAGMGGKSLVFSPDGQTVAAYVAGNPYGVRVLNQPNPGPVPDVLHFWDVTTGKEVRKIPVPQYGVTNLAYSPDGRVLATENADQTISLWEVASGKERARLGKTTAKLPSTVRYVYYGRPNTTGNTLAFSPDGALLAAKGQGNAVAVWEVMHGKEIGQFQGHDGAIATLAFAADGKSLASGSNDTTILVWEVAGLKRTPSPAVVVLQPKEADALWADLLGNDAAKAFGSILRLSECPKEAAAYLRERLKPAATVDPKKLEGLVNDLNSNNFKVRTRATDELAALGELAVPALQKVLDTQPPLETRRRVTTLLEKLVGGALTGEQIRLVRAVEVLEKLGTAEGRQVLEALANGAPGALATRQAQAALQRISGK